MEPVAPESIHWLWWPLFAVINVPLLTPVFRWLFGDLGGFLEALRYELMPDLLSLVRGKWKDDFDAEIKLLILIGCTAVLFYAERRLVLNIF
jgi:hypothetical protein